MVITDKNGKPAVSYGSNSAMTYGASPTDLDVTFGYGSLETVLGKIGHTDGLIAFGKDATTGSGIIVANGALASSKVLDVQVKAEVPATYYEAGDDEVIAGTKLAGDVKTEFVPAGLEITYASLGEDKKPEKSTISISNTALEKRVKALEDFNTVADSDEKINTVKDILDWFDSVSEQGETDYKVTVDGKEVALGKGQAGLLTTVAEAKNAIGVKEVSHPATADEVAAGTADAEGDKVVDTPATGLYKEIADAVANASAAIEALDVVETTVGEGNVTFKYAQTDGLVDISTLEVKETAGTFTAAVEAAEGVEAAPATLSVAEADKTKLLNAGAIANIKAYVDAVAAANQEGISIAEDSVDYLSVDADDDHKIAVKTTALGAAVGMSKEVDGEGNVTWKKADGTVGDAPGLATAADVAAEIVADEEVIAAALNEHETRIKSLESLTTSYSVAEADAPYISVASVKTGSATEVTVDVSVIDSSSAIEGLTNESADQLVSAKAVKAYVEYKLQWLNLDAQA